MRSNKSKSNKRLYGKGKNKKGKRSAEEKQNFYVEMPTEFIPNKVVKYMRRYVTTVSGISDYTITDLINSKIFAATTTAGYSPYFALRVKRVRLWGPMTTIGTPVTVNLFPRAVETDINSYSDVPQVISDTATSIEKPAFIQYKPDSKHPSGSWHHTTSTSTNLFRFAYVAGSILEILIEAVENVTLATQGFTTTLVGASVGGLYTRNVATNFSPVTVNTI
jgi:hypothetical protein